MHDKGKSFTGELVACGIVGMRYGIIDDLYEIIVEQELGICIAQSINEHLLAEGVFYHEFQC